MSTIRHYGGTGLGLSISERLVKLMNGRIWLESEVGKGSKFHFEVSFQPAESQVKHPGPGYDSIPEPQLVLIADDNHMNLRMLKRVFSEWGAASVTALGGPEALDVFREHSLRNIIFSAAILDVDMKDIDGLQLARLIAASPGATQIIEMLHSPLDNEHARECKRLGLFTILKPLRRLPLRQVLQSQKAMTVSSNGARHPQLRRRFRVLWNFAFCLPKTTS